MKLSLKLMAMMLCLLVARPSEACTNFLVTKAASADGSTMITYAADSHYLFGELYFRPAADYPDGSWYDVYEWDTGRYLGRIPQVRHTYSVVGNMNEFQLAIGETTYGGRPELTDTTGLIDYGSLIYLTLQRARSAREAIAVIARLLDEHGYFSSGESFSIADKDEVWVMEMIGKGTRMVTDKKTKKSHNADKGAVWVAIRIPDGYVSGHANQARITTFPLENMRTSISSKNMDKLFEPSVEVVYSHDVISFARSKGYFSGKDEEFSFSDTYAPVDFSGARFCEARVWSFFKDVNKDMARYEDYALGKNLAHRMPLYIKPDRKISVRDMMNFMRDHYEGTSIDMTKDMGAGPHALPYRWRPMTWKYDGKGYVHERATATQQTGFSFVTQSRSWLPDAIGGILWFGVDDAATTVYFPAYCSSTKVAEAYAQGNGDLLNYRDHCAFWTFNKVSNFAYLRYDLMSAEIKKVQDELEERFIRTTSTVDAEAQRLHEANPQEAVRYLTDYSVSAGNYVEARWEQLFRYLMVKFIDGNVKRQNPDGSFRYNEHHYCPDHVDNFDYPDWWKKMLIESTGDKLKAL
ncbi:MAG: C69 family dipeptidase [Bacteroidales bacterium]|nr:C69 family dipeptidase [Bacteroidales bacterium]